jgi:histone deacetylase 6
LNNGELSAKGTKVNIPFDFVDKSFKPYNFQSPGDNEYIYAYHRIIEPVLKEFNPDVILISSGFDAANGDPLGGFTITPNGYYYLTKMILDLRKPTLVALEGGYNL